MHLYAAGVCRGQAIVDGRDTSRRIIRRAGSCRFATVQATGDQPSQLDATPSRIRRLAELLHGRDVEARVLREDHRGELRSGSRPDAVMVGDVEIVVPAHAQIRLRARDNAIGIDVNSDNKPEPPGTWIWVRCEVVGECHDVFADLSLV